MNVKNGSKIDLSDIALPRYGKSLFERIKQGLNTLYGGFRL